MTKNNELKRRIRERMQRTGERYTAARAQVLAGGVPATQRDAYPGLHPGYGTLGGAQSDSALLARVFAHAGIVHPQTGEPYSEAMIHGLCGGVGFLYAVFEYKGHAPMLTLALRSRSMPQTYIENVFERVGAERSVSTTTSPRVAAKALDAALEDKRPAVCVVDLAGLPYTHLAPEMAGMSPHYVAVIGADGDNVWLDDRSLAPIAVTRAELDAARKANRSAKHALFTVSPAAESVDWKKALGSAIQDTANTIRDGDPTVPASFRTNCGLSGMKKWHGLLTDAKDKKGWPRVLTEGPNALAGLRRAYDGIQHEYTPAAGGRPLYAEFLDEAAQLLGNKQLPAAAQIYRESGARWHDLAECVAGTPDEAVAHACRLADRRAQALDEGGVAELKKVLGEKPGECKLSADAALGVYAEMAEILAEIIELETRAADALDG